MGQQVVHADEVSEPGNHGFLEGTPGKPVVGRFTDPEGNLIGVAGVQ